MIDIKNITKVANTNLSAKFGSDYTFNLDVTYKYDSLSWFKQFGYMLLGIKESELGWIHINNRYVGRMMSLPYVLVGSDLNLVFVSTKQGGEVFSTPKELEAIILKQEVLDGT